MSAWEWRCFVRCNEGRNQASSALIKHAKKLINSKRHREERRTDVYVLVCVLKDEDHKLYGLKYRGGGISGTPEVKFRTGVREKVAGLERWEKVIGITQPAKAFRERGIALASQGFTEFCRITTVKSRANAYVEGGVCLEVAEIKVKVELLCVEDDEGGKEGGKDGGEGTAAAATVAEAEAGTVASGALDQAPRAGGVEESVGEVRESLAKAAASAAEAAATTAAALALPLADYAISALATATPTSTATATPTATATATTSDTWVSICVEAKSADSVETFLNTSGLAKEVRERESGTSLVLGGYPTLMLHLLKEARAPPSSEGKRS